MAEQELLSSTSLVWPIVLLVAGLLLVVAEVFVPSGGVLGVLAAAAFVGSVVMAFWQGGAMTGTIFFIVAALGIPVIIGVAFSLLPKTPFGRRLILPAARREDFDASTERDRELQELVGRVGRTITPLRPAGLTEIDGRRIDTLAEGVVVDEGTLVRVIAVQGRRVLVREVDDEQGSA